MIKFPLDQRTSKHSILVKVISRGNLHPIKFTELCPAVDLCTVIECEICLEKIVNVHCYKFLNYVILAGLFFFSAICCSLFVIAVYFFRTIAIVFKCIFHCLRISSLLVYRVIMKWTRKITRRLSRASSYELVAS